VQWSPEKLKQRGSGGRKAREQSMAFRFHDVRRSLSMAV
jgi:hypothetical protein